MHVDQELWSVESLGRDRRSSGKKYNVIGPHVVDDSITGTLDEVQEPEDTRHLLDLEEIVDERSTLKSTKSCMV